MIRHIAQVTAKYLSKYRHIAVYRRLDEAKLSKVPNHVIFNVSLDIFSIEDRYYSTLP